MANPEGQSKETVVIQLQVNEFLQPAKLHREGRDLVLAEIEGLERLLEGGIAESRTKGLQVVVLQTELLQPHQVSNGLWQLLDTIVTQVQLPETPEGKHAHVNAGQFAVGGLEVLQGVGEAPSQRIFSPGHDGHPGLGLLDLRGFGWD